MPDCRCRGPLIFGLGLSGWRAGAAGQARPGGFSTGLSGRARRAEPTGPPWPVPDCLCRTCNLRVYPSGWAFPVGGRERRGELDRPGFSAGPVEPNLRPNRPDPLAGAGLPLPRTCNLKVYPSGWAFPVGGRERRGELDPGGFSAELSGRARRTEPPTEPTGPPGRCQTAGAADL